MTKEMIFNNKYFNIFILFINTSVIDAFYKALKIPPSAISIPRLLINSIFILMVIYYLLTERIKGRQYLLTIILFIFIGMTLLWTPEKIAPFKTYINFVGASCYFLLFFCISYKENIVKTLKGYCDVIIIANTLALTILHGVGYMGETVKAMVPSGIHLSRSSFIIHLIFCLFIYIYFLKSISYSRKQKIGVYIMIATDIALVIISKSSTGVIAVALFIPLLLLSKYKTLSKILIRVVIIIGISLPVIRFSSSSINKLALTLFHKNLTFSGRTYIWDYILKKMIANPIIGNGFESTTFILKKIIIPNYDRIAAHTHNGFLELFFQLGMIGLVLTIAILLITFRYSFRVNNKESSVIRIYFIIFIIFNFMEPFMIGNVSITTLWLPIIYTITLANKKMREKISE